VAVAVAKAVSVAQNQNQVKAVVLVDIHSQHTVFQVDKLLFTQLVPLVLAVVLSLAAHQAARHPCRVVPNQ
jgi:hypothetical protein